MRSIIGWIGALLTPARPIRICTGCEIRVEHCQCSAWRIVT